MTCNRPGRDLLPSRAMRPAVWHLAAWRTIAALALFAAAPLRADAPSKDAVVTTAFVHVNVLPMDAEHVLRDQTVIVENGRITAIGPELRVPPKARVVDGHGTAFLSPGLADMHTHADTRNDLAVYLANGVTTVLNMGEASPGFIARDRRRANAGEIPGPHVYAAFMVDGSPQYGHFVVTTGEEARALVRLARTNGYDFIKVYNNLSPECFEALADEGKRRHMPIVGHGVTAVGLERQLDAGQVLVAHTEEFMYTTFADPDAPPDAAPDAAAIPRAIEFVRRDRAFVTADLNTYATIARQWGRPDVVGQFLHMRQTRYLSPDRRIAWKNEGYARRKGSLDARLTFLKRFTRELADAGIPLVTGTDAPAIPGLVPGLSLHDDLRALEDAGLSRYQALAAATRTSGEFIARSIDDAVPFGTIEPGRRADLVLSAANPLDDLATLREPLGVMANGRWYPKEELDALLENVAAAYEAVSLRP